MSDFERSDAEGVLTFTLTREAKLNAVTDAMLDGLRSAVREVAERPDLRVLVITGRGRYFSAGMDITGMPANTGTGQQLRHGYRQLHDLFDEIESVEKQVVLAAQGPCLGVGLELAASCDFRLAADTAVFGLPEIETLGVIPGSGGISRLARLVGPHWTSWLAVAGQKVAAAQALTIGLVHEVVPAAELEARVQAFAAHLASLSPAAMGLAKLGIALSVTADRTSARDFDRVANTLLLESAEHKAKVAAFLQR